METQSMICTHLPYLKPNAKKPFKIEITEVPDLDDDGAIGLVDVEMLLKINRNISKLLKL